MHTKHILISGILGGALVFSACQRDARDSVYEREKARAEERARAAETTTPPYGSTVGEAASPSGDTRSGATMPGAKAGQAHPSDTMAPDTSGTGSSGAGSSGTSGTNAPVTGTGTAGSTGSTTGTRDGIRPPTDDAPPDATSGTGVSGTSADRNRALPAGTPRDQLIDELYQQYSQTGGGSLDRDTFVSRCTESARGLNTSTLTSSDRDYFARNEVRTRCRDLQQMPIGNDASRTPTDDGTGTDSRGNPVTPSDVPR